MTCPVTTGSRRWNQDRASCLQDHCLSLLSVTACLALSFAAVLGHVRGRIQRTSSVLRVLTIPRQILVLMHFMLEMEWCYILPLSCQAWAISWVLCFPRTSKAVQPLTVSRAANLDLSCASTWLQSEALDPGSQKEGGICENDCWRREEVRIYSVGIARYLSIYAVVLHWQIEAWINIFKSSWDFCRFCISEWEQL